MYPPGPTSAYPYPPDPSHLHSSSGVTPYHQHPEFSGVSGVDEVKARLRHMEEVERRSGVGLTPSAATTATATAVPGGGEGRGGGEYIHPSSFSPSTKKGDGMFQFKRYLEEKLQNFEKDRDIIQYLIEQIYKQLPERGESREIDKFVDGTIWDRDDYSRWTLESQRVEKIVNYLKGALESLKSRRDSCELKSDEEKLEKIRRLIIRRSEILKGCREEMKEGHSVFFSEQEEKMNAILATYKTKLEKHEIAKTRFDLKGEVERVEKSIAFILEGRGDDIATS